MKKALIASVAVNVGAIAFSIRAYSLFSKLYYEKVERMRNKPLRDPMKDYSQCNCACGR